MCGSSNYWIIEHQINGTRLYLQVIEMHSFDECIKIDLQPCKFQDTNDESVVSPGWIKQVDLSPVDHIPKAKVLLTERNVTSSMG